MLARTCSALCSLPTRLDCVASLPTPSPMLACTAPPARVSLTSSIAASANSWAAPTWWLRASASRTSNCSVARGSGAAATPGSAAALLVSGAVCSSTQRASAGAVSATATASASGKEKGLMAGSLCGLADPRSADVRAYSASIRTPPWTADGLQMGRRWAAAVQPGRTPNSTASTWHPAQRTTAGDWPAYRAAPARPQLGALPGREFSDTATVKNTISNAVVRQTPSTQRG